MAKPIFIIALPEIDSDDAQALKGSVEKGLNNEYNVVVVGDYNLSKCEFHVLNGNNINHYDHEKVVSEIKQKINL